MWWIKALVGLKTNLLPPSLVSVCLAALADQATFEGGFFVLEDADARTV